MTKTLKVLAISALMIIMACILITPAYANNEKTGVITGEDVNIRSAGNTSSEILGQLSKDTVVTVYRYVDGWYEVNFKESKGWVYGWYLYVEGEAMGVGTITANGVNIRSDASLNAKVLTQLNKGDEVMVYGQSEDWYKIGFDDITGWVFGDFLKLVEKPLDTGVITGDSVNIRREADIKSEVVTKLNKGDTVEVFSISGDWYNIRMQDNQMGWVFKSFIKTNSSTNVSRGSGASEGSSTLPKTNSVTAKAEEVVSYAKKFLGIKYVWGGESPNGFDCSGFVKYVYQHFGIKLYHNSAIMVDSGVKVDKKNLKAGDVLFFNTDGAKGIDHVGIYIGDGKFIHASSSQKKVIVTDMSTGYVKFFVTARRMIQ